VLFISSSKNHQPLTDRGTTTGTVCCQESARKLEMDEHAAINFKILSFLGTQSTPSEIYAFCVTKGILVSSLCKLTNYKITSGGKSDYLSEI
jgi:hypothetical protein